MKEPALTLLVKAQQAIDRGNKAAARSSLALFLERWKGDPPELVVYVEDIQRYLSDDETTP